VSDQPGTPWLFPGWAALTAGNWTGYAAGLDRGADPGASDAEHRH
jgi:hypothetical protein